jgi:alkanesulfonate monooxygenase SsuD/methylene tetrahydromethanopterin reductase-like flavin-dependent oxidoreductase (luciferase family)
VRFGLFLSCQHPIGSDMVLRLDEHLKQTHLAGEAGFDAVFYGEHFLMPPFQMLHEATFLARVAAEAGPMHVGTGILLLALHNPVEVADMIATLDVITKGRFIFGVGLGYRDVEFDAFNVPRKEAARRFEERLMIIKRLWSDEEKIDYEGLGFKLTQATCTLKPVQKPHPPIWIAANNDGAVKRAARMGDAWYINPHAKMSVIEEQWRLYKATLQEVGKPLPATLPLMKELYVDETQARAEATARPYLENKYKAYVQWGQDKALPKTDALDLPFDELVEDRFVVGDPDYVIRSLENYVQKLGVNFLCFRLQWPGMEHDAAVRGIRLLGQHVIPYFKRKYGAG